MTARGTDIAEWLRQQLTVAGAHGFVVGLSGGLDSAVVARLCQMAAPGQVVGVLMPCHSDARDEADARMVAEHFDIPTFLDRSGPAYDRLLGVSGRLHESSTGPGAAIERRPGRSAGAVRCQKRAHESAAREREAAAANDDAYFVAN